MNGVDANRGTDADERARYREFVRTHHPDRGGDPAVFVAGLAEFARRRELDARADAPVQFVTTPPLPLRFAIAVIRTVRKRRTPRVQ